MMQIHSLFTIFILLCPSITKSGYSSCPSQADQCNGYRQKRGFYTENGYKIFPPLIRAPALKVAAKRDANYDLVDDNINPYGSDQAIAPTSSLAIVFDITGSMYDDLVQVREGAARIVRSSLLKERARAGTKISNDPAKRSESNDLAMPTVIRNYVLVPFNDPEIGPPQITNDPQEFQKFLHDLFIQGGGDCPEMSIGAIRAALQLSLPASSIYVFTDARAKDYNLTDEVLLLIQKTQSQVVFVLTGDCGNQSHPGYIAYERIAATSSGQVFNLKKSDVHELLNFIELTLKTSKVNLMSYDKIESGSEIIELPVDSHLDSITISLAGMHRHLRIQNGQDLDSNIGDGYPYNIVVDTEKAYVINIPKPNPGTWKLSVSGSGKRTLRVTGLSTLEFDVGFTINPRRFEEFTTVLRPYSFIPTYLWIRSVNLPYPGRLDDFQILTIEGKVLFNSTLSRISRFPIFYENQVESSEASRPTSYVYVSADTFLTPNDYFYVAFSGKDDKGYNFKRYSFLPFAPNIPDVPQVFSFPSLKEYEGNNMNINCDIKSQVPFTLEWFRDGMPLDTQRFPSGMSNASFKVTALRASDMGRYTCNASNPSGWTSADIMVDVLSKNPPRSRSPTAQWSGISELSNDPKDNYSNVTAYIDSDVEIQCPVKYIMAGDTVSWYMGKGEISRSRLLKKIKASDYFASNRGEDAGKYSLRFAISSSNDEESQLNPNYQDSTDYYSNKLIIKNVNHDDIGFYTCHVESEDGMEDALVWVHAQGYLSVKIVPGNDIKYREGETIKIECQVQGNPLPHIFWSKNKKPVYNSQKIEIGSRFLIIKEANEMESGLYTCTAYNSVGIKHETTLLTMVKMPVVRAIESNVAIKLGKQATLMCNIVNSREHDKDVPNSWIWFKDGIRVFNRSNMQVHENKLYIEQMYAEYAGKYTCQIENEFGNSHALINLEMGAKPILFHDKLEMEVKEGKDVFLMCSPQGDPQPSITWRFKDKLADRFTIIPLQNALKSDFNVPRDEVLANKYNLTQGLGLMVTRTTPEDMGIYSCSADNKYGTSNINITLTVLPDPSNRSRFKKIKLSLGESVVLDCLSSLRSPHKLWKWFKDKKLITKYHTDPNLQLYPNGSLLFDGANQTHSGKYECLESYETENYVTQYEIVIEAVPTVIENSKHDIFAILNQNLTIECPIIGSPPMQYKWLKNRVDWDNPTNIKIFHDGKSIFFNKVSQSDRAIYGCQAINEFGTNSFEMRMDIMVPPKIIYPGKKMTTLEISTNVSKKMTCVANGYPKPDVNWKKNGINLDTGTTLHISPHLFDGQDSILLQCIATNMAGADDVIIEARSISPPSFNLNPASDNLMLQTGDSTQFLCDTRDIAGTKIKWLFNGVSIAGNSGYESILTGLDSFPSHDSSIDITNDGHILKISPLRENHSGNYTCVAINAAGSAIKNYYLTVAYAPKILDPQYNLGSDPKPIVLGQGSDTTLSCQIEGLPQPSIKWWREVVGRNKLNIPAIDDEVVESGPSKRVYYASHPASGSNSSKMTSNLFINRARFSDTGRYVCGGENALGSIRSNFSVEAIGKPIDNMLTQKATRRQSGSLNNIKISAGEGHQLKCSYSGNPLPTLEWFKDGQPLEHLFSINNVADTVNFSLDSVLSIPKAEEDFSGVYECRASNAHGYALQTFKVNVVVPPSIMASQNGPSIVEVMEGGRTTLRCPIQGEPQPRIVWSKNGKDIEFAHYKRPNDLKYYPMGERGQELIILKVDLNSDNGATFSCTPNTDDSTLAYSVGPIVRKNFVIKVLVRPFILDGRDEEIIRSAGEKISLWCQYRAEPTGSITWMKNGRQISFTERLSTEKIENGEGLIIRDLDTQDTGKYSCGVSNKIGRVSKHFMLKITSKPSIFGKKVNELQVRSGLNISLLCTIDFGAADADIYWTKDGKILFDNIDNDGTDIVSMEILRINRSSSELKINPVASRLSGSTFVCNANNSAGKMTKKFIIDVRETLALKAPFFINGTSASTEEINALLNEPMSLSCVTKGTPPPIIRWYKGNQLLNQQGKLQTYHGDISFSENDQKLTISRVMPTHIGQYMCKVANSVGKTEKLFKVSLYAKPRIDNMDYDSSNADIESNGKNLFIKCFARKYPQPFNSDLTDTIFNDVHRKLLKINGSMAYRIGNKCSRIDLAYVNEVYKHLIPNNIIDESNDSVIIKCEYNDYEEVVAEDEINADFEKSWNTQLYTCQYLGILEPTDLKRKAKQEITEIISIRGFPSKMVCHVSGAPSPAIKWYHYKVADEILVGDDIQKFLDGNYSSMMDDLITTGRMREIVNVTDNAILSSQDSIQIQSNPIIYISQDNKQNLDTTLYIEQTLEHHKGLYMCQAENTAGKNFKLYHVQVTVFPSIDPPFSTIMGLQGDTIVLKCNATGSPAPVITWIKGEQTLKDTKFPRGTVKMFLGHENTTLTINDIDQEDQGVYLCMAQNSAGTATSQTSVEIYSHPYITMDETTFNTAENMPFTLPCTSSGSPKPKNIWSKDGRLIDELDYRYKLLQSGHLLIILTSKDDSGTYTCKASNLIGDVNATMNLAVQVAPSIEDISKIHHFPVKEHDYVELPCVVSGSPMPEVSWLKDGIPIERFNRRGDLLMTNSFIIFSAKKTDTGVYSCVASNSVGDEKIEYSLVVSELR